MLFFELYIAIEINILPSSLDWPSGHGQPQLKVISEVTQHSGSWFLKNWELNVAFDEIVLMTVAFMARATHEVIEHQENGN